MHGRSHSMRLFSFPTEFIQSSYPDDEQSSSDLFLTPHPLSSSLSDRQESNTTDKLTGQGCVKVLGGGGGVERCWADGGLMFKLFSPSLGKEQSCFYFEGQERRCSFLIFFFWQKPDTFLATIDTGKKDRMEFGSVFSTGCASRREQGKEGATGCCGSEGWRLLICLLEQQALLRGKGVVWSWSPSVSKGCVALAWSSTSPRKMAWSGLRLILHLTQLEDSPRGSGWYPTKGAGEWGLVSGASLCLRLACAGWFSWTPAQVGLLATTKSWEETVS